MKLLITGANGQLGSEIKALVSDYKIVDVVFKDYKLFKPKKDLLLIYNNKIYEKILE